MPRVRVAAKKRRVVRDYDENVRELFTDGTCLEWTLDQEEPSVEEARALWEEYGPRFLVEWASKHPGTRPALWWKFSAPEPRRVVALEYTPFFGLEEPPGRKRWEVPAGTPRDEIKPPERVQPCSSTKFILEPEREYLERHGLLFDGEVTDGAL